MDQKATLLFFVPCSNLSGRFVRTLPSVIIIIIIIIIIAITFMHGIYNYIPETNRVSRVYNVAAVVYYYSNTSRSTCAVRNMSVFFLWFLNFALSRYAARVLSE